MGFAELEVRLEPLQLTSARRAAVEPPFPGDPNARVRMPGGTVEHFAHVWLDPGEQAAEETAVGHLTRLWARAIGLTDASRSARPEEGT
ncbi:hypothetical protein E1267_37885 [Nonomuraea longispora]|uniref:Uncharacterized protein n=1 Tax=Nonomuraea longispora TaxID=1848320 RepID=A0A4R4MV58_9ACTN|nr:hypothetical protein [Nonomuraea longispora]TDB99213.1 hypothetical protein E1267_37885 [Nonomuraea longispora]